MKMLLEKHCVKYIYVHHYLFWKVSMNIVFKEKFIILVLVLLYSIAKPAENISNQVGINESVNFYEQMVDRSRSWQMVPSWLVDEANLRGVGVGSLNKRFIEAINCVDLEAVESLIEARASVNQRMLNGRLPLEHILELNFNFELLPIFQCLIEAGGRIQDCTTTKIESGFGKCTRFPVFRYWWMKNNQKRVRMAAMLEFESKVNDKRKDNCISLVRQYTSCPKELAILVAQFTFSSEITSLEVLHKGREVMQGCDLQLAYTVVSEDD